MSKIAHLLILAIASSCASQQNSGPPEDVTAWRGVPLSELEMHPAYSAMRLEKREVSTGEVLYNYVNSAQDSVNCYNNGYGYTSCSGGGTISCTHQFVVKGNVVIDYRPTGHCRTGCDRRPASRPCPPPSGILDKMFN